MAKKLAPTTGSRRRDAELDPSITAIAEAPQADFDAALAKVAATNSDGMNILPFLKREKKLAELPAKEDMVVAPNLSRTPLELASDGMNILEISLYCGTDYETGLRRYLAVSMGDKNAQLLHVPDLEHVEVDVRYINERIASGKAHWYALPHDLADRLIAKSVQWEMNGMRYSRSLVNEALINLGRPPLEEPKALAAVPGTVAFEKATARAKAKAERGPGVIETLISLLKAGGGTIDELLEGLVELFPDRGEGMRGTIKTQLNRLPKQGKLKIKKVGDRYMAEGAEEAQQPALAKTGEVDAIAKGHLPASMAPNKGNDFIPQLRKQEALEKELTERPIGTLKPAKAVAKARAKAKGHKKVKGKKKR